MGGAFGLSNAAWAAPFIARWLLFKLAALADGDPENCGTVTALTVGVGVGVVVVVVVGMNDAPPLFRLDRLDLGPLRLDPLRLDRFDLDPLLCLDLDPLRLEPPTFKPEFARTRRLWSAAAAAFWLAKSGVFVTGAGIGAPGALCGMFGFDTIGAYGFGVGVGVGVVVVIALMWMRAYIMNALIN